MPDKQQTLVRLLVAATPHQAEVFQEQIERFEKQHPDIQVALLAVPYSEFNRLLLTLIQAGYPLDTAILSYNLIVQLQLEERLIPLNDLAADPEVNLSDFLPAARDSNIVNGQQVGLPWARSGCEQHYRSLALLKTSEHASAAFELMKFMILPLQQIEYFIRLKWFPTRPSVYDRLGIACPDPANLIRPAPEHVARIVGVVNERSRNLDAVLQGLTLNAYESTAVIEHSDPPGTARPGLADGLEANDEIQVALAPGMDPISEEELAARLASGTGLIIGALFVNQELPVQNASGETVITIAAGDYAVQLQADSTAPLGVRSYLVSPDGGMEIEVPVHGFEATSGPAVQPSCAVETGSTRLCWIFDNRQYCF